MTTLAQVLAANMTIRGDARAEEDITKEKTHGAVKACMTGIATAFHGFNGNDDAMKATIKDGWWIYASARKLTDTKGNAYANADAMPVATLSDYLTFARAGVSGAFTTANAVVTEYQKTGKGAWYQLTRDLIRKNAKGEMPITVESVKTLAVKAKGRDDAVDALIRAVKRAAKDFGFGAENVIASLNGIKALPAAARPAPVRAVVPSTAPVVETPTFVPPSPSAGAPMDMAAMIGQLVSNPQFMQQMAAFVPAPVVAKK